METALKFGDRILAGVNASFDKLIEKTKKTDGKLVIIKDGKIVHIKARDLK